MDVRVPTAEALVELKTGTAVSMNRSSAARLQDQSDIAKICESCPWLDERKVQAIAHTVSPELAAITKQVVEEFLPPKRS